MELQGKPDSEHAMQRLEAWPKHETLDCLPVRFGEHNADFAGVHLSVGRAWPLGFQRVPVEQVGLREHDFRRDLSVKSAPLTKP